MGHIEEDVGPLMPNLQRLMVKQVEKASAMTTGNLLGTTQMLGQGGDIIMPAQNCVQSPKHNWCNEDVECEGS